MESGHYYYNNMPSEIKIKWMAEWRAQSTGQNLNLVLDSKYKSFKQFILQSFPWHKTSQGHTFWRAISNRNQVDEAIAILEDIDGDQLEQLINKLGMEDQILRQLVMKASDQTLDDLLKEKKSLILSF
jgi:hypothetical protein